MHLQVIWAVHVCSTRNVGKGRKHRHRQSNTLTFDLDAVGALLRLDSDPRHTWCAFVRVLHEFVYKFVYLLSPNLCTNQCLVTCTHHSPTQGKPSHTSPHLFVFSHWSRTWRVSVHHPRVARTTRSHHAHLHLRADQLTFKGRCCACHLEAAD